MNNKRNMRAFAVLAVTVMCGVSAAVTGCKKKKSAEVPAQAQASIIGEWVPASGEEHGISIDKDSVWYDIFTEGSVTVHISKDTVFFKSAEGGKFTSIYEIIKLTEDSLVLKDLETDSLGRYGRMAAPTDASASENTEDESAELSDDSVMAELEGDLDKDGVIERVKAVRLAGSGGDDVENYLLIEKKSGSDWRFFFADSSVLGLSDWNTDGGSRDAGTLSIERGTLLLEERAGTFQSTRSRYRWQNDDMYLIGATSYSSFESDDGGFTRATDCNLLTGDVEVKDTKGDSMFNKHTFKSADIKPIKMHGYGQNFRIADPVSGDTIRMSIHDQE